MSTNSKSSNNNTKSNNNNKKGDNKAMNNHYGRMPQGTIGAAAVPSAQAVVATPIVEQSAPVDVAVDVAVAAPVDVAVAAPVDVAVAAPVDVAVAAPVAAQEATPTQSKLLAAVSSNDNQNLDQTRMFDMLVSIIGDQQRMLATYQQQTQQTQQVLQQAQEAQQQQPFSGFQPQQVVLMPPMPPFINMASLQVQPQQGAFKRVVATQTAQKTPAAQAPPAAKQAPPAAKQAPPAQAAQAKQAAQLAHAAQAAQVAHPAQAAQATPHAAKPDNNEPPEFAPYDLILEEDCADGFNCPNSKNPDKCPQNHQRLGSVIKKGARIPRFFCKWERPWKTGPNGKPMRCHNPKCFNGHLDKRREFITRAQQYKENPAKEATV